MSQLTKHLLGDSHHVGELIQKGQTEQMEPTQFCMRSSQFDRF